jgi:hypothetical protein
MVQIVPGDLIQVALSVQDRITLDEFCDLTERGRSEVVQEAVRHYLELHAPIVRVGKAIEQMQKELLGKYEIPIPPELQ